MNVQLFVTCLIDSLFPETGAAVVEVLNHAGYSVKFRREQTCCGQPAYNAGYWPAAREMARRTIEIFDGGSDPVVIPSGSCAHMIRHGYPELFRDDAELFKKANALAERTFELSEFIVSRSAWRPIREADTCRYAYHPSCHLLRGIGVSEEPVQLLKASGYKHVVELSPECCGFGGVFAVDHAPISNEMLARRLSEIESKEVDAVVGCDVSCLMNIEGALRRSGSNVRCTHIAALLAGREIGLR
jgi:L-lactate dehydrogenase complex protein LldE